MSDYVDTVDIEGTQYDIQDTATKQTAEQNSQKAQLAKNGQGFSLTETVLLGTTEDGKPLYKITATGNTGNVTGADAVSLIPPIANLKQIYEISGFVIGDNNAFYPLQYFQNQSSNSVALYSSAVGLYYLTDFSRLKNRPYTASIVYSKTTD